MSIKQCVQVIPVVALFLLTILGCNRTDNQPATGHDEKNPTMTLTIAYGEGTGVMWNLVAESVAQLIREEYPGSRVTAITGSSDGNLARLQRGEIEMAISATDSANIALNGQEVFTKPIPLEDVKSIAQLYYAKLHLVVLSRFEVNSIEEIKEKKLPLKISVGSRGSGIERGARRILEKYEITYEDIENWGGKVIFVGHSDSARMMGDGQLNASFGLSAVPMSSLTELAMKRDFKLLPFREDVIEMMIEEFDYSPGIIHAGAYKGLAEDIPTISVGNGIFASGKLDEQAAYLITKTLIDNIDRLRQIHRQVSDITAESMNQQMVYPVHQGAQRAYQQAAQD